MNKTKIIKRIMEHPVMQEKPPVLIDIGASYKIHEGWKDIAPYSICLAFDADNRDFSIEERLDRGYKKLFLINKIVVADKQEKSIFYLTKAPYCSSTLMPLSKVLQQWKMSPLFDIEKDVFLQSVTLPEIMRKSGIDYVDWFKTDSQGTDLRLFCSLGNGIIDQVKLAEFEPGLIDAYCGEDKFSDLLRWMEAKPFFLDRLEVKEINRISIETINKCLKNRIKNPEKSLFDGKPTPAWVNAAYLRTAASCEKWNLRDILLFCCICILRGQFGVCYEAAEILKEKFPLEGKGDEILDFAAKKIRKQAKRTLIYRVRRRLNIMFANWLRYAEF